MDDILSFLDAHSKNEPPRRRAKKGFKFKMPPPFSLSTQALVIFLRFGTIKSDRKVWLSPKEVLLRTGVRTSAQSNIIRRWRQRGYVVTSHLKHRGRKRMLTQNQINYLKYPKVLQEWSHLSLEERAVRMREKFDLPRLSANTLRDYYHRSKVQYRKPQFIYAQKARTLRKISDDQQAFCKTLSRLLMADREEVIYIDETTFHLWMHSSRCWVTRDMTLTLPTERGKSITLIGALSSRRGLVHYSIFEGSNNAETFLDFLQRLKLKCRNDPAVIVQDNLSVHRAGAVMQLYDATFRHMFLPTYSSVLNPIERVWNVIKQEWRQTQHLHAR